MHEISWGRIYILGLDRLKGLNCVYDMLFDKLDYIIGQYFMRSVLEPWKRHCVLGKDTLLSRCLSPPRCINGNWLTWYAPWLIWRCLLYTILVCSPHTTKSYFDSEMPNYNKLIPSILDHSLETLPKHCHLTPGKTLFVVSCLQISCNIYRCSFDCCDIYTGEV